MGGFFLYRKDETDIDLDAVRTVFGKKGFAAPRVFDLRKMTLWLYQKQLVSDPNYVSHEDGAALYATGTVVYTGLSYRDSLRRLLEDYRQKQLDLTALLGNFCLLFSVNDRIEILTDRLNMHHIFVDDELSRLSTSFLAMLASFSDPVSLNRLAFYEKISTGYIVGPDTLISRVQKITPRFQDILQTRRFSFIPHPRGDETREVSLCSDGFESCVEHQLEVLLRCFGQTVALADEYGADLGLSAGYDSRLALLLLRYLGVPLSVHTHHTEGVHETEHHLAQEVAEACDTELRVVRTRRMEEQDEGNLARLLSDGLYYYDGRNADNSGAFSPTYTREYKRATLGEQRLRFNGEGGELYRNYYYTSREEFDFSSWMRHHVYYLFAEAVIPKADLRHDVHCHIIRKLSERLGVDLARSVDQLTMRRYHGEIRLPDCEGTLANADNQLAFFMMPFAEPSVTTAAYEATPYIGIDGRFQAALMTRLDATVAAVDSHYGFPFTRQPWHHQVYAALRGYLPDWFWNIRRRFRVRHRNLGQSSYDTYVDLRQRSRTIQQLEDVLYKCFPELDWQMAMRSRPQQATVLFLASLIREFEDQIRW